jgi:flavin reductase (DIM6/NTAB) family NADH-FMN oxidoreductase RutF
MHFDPETLDPNDRYKLLIGGIVPRPIAFVSTIAPNITFTPGSSRGLNLAPFSFFAGVGSNPMTLLFCPANKPDGSEKDTLRNAKPIAEGGTGEFVVNVVSEYLARQMAACAEPLPYGEAEFDLANLTPAPSSIVAPPRVAQCLMAFECRTMQVIRTNPGAPGGGNIVLGRVVHIHAAENLVNERLHVDASMLDAIGRMGGNSYCRTRDRFDVPRGIDATATERRTS